MSLKVWLPLNGSLENKGISNITVTNNGATVDTSGKIGSCYSFNGSTGYISLVGTQLFQIFTGGTQQFSITMWVYHTDATRAILFGDHSTSGAINFNIELSTGHGVRFYWNGSPDTYPSNATVAASSWTHVTLTYNGSLLQSYINGVAKGSWSGTLGTKNKISGEFRLGRDSRSDSTAFNGKMNDFRVYDHCLSAAEVKEISQGLVLHYKLDSYNLFNFNTLTQNTYLLSNGTIATDSNWALTDYIPITPLKSYIGYNLVNGGNGNPSICYYTNDKVFNRGEKITANAPLNITAQANECYVRISIRKTNNDINKMSFMEIPTMIQDSSGYNHNGSILNATSISSDTPRYSASINLSAGNSMINCGRGGMVTDSITVNFWLKSSSWANPVSCTENGGWNFESSDTCFRFPVYVSGVRYKYGKSTTTRAQICNNEWHMLTGIYDRINQKIQIYVDGQLDNDYATNTSNNIRYHSSNCIWIGAEATASNTTASNGMIGLFSDFRIYCTALSAADVKQLYEMGAKVDNKQNLHTYEIKETNNNLLAGKVWTNSYGNKNPSTAAFTNFNSNGEYQFTTNGTSAGSEYIPINPTGHTYEYDYTISVNAGNQFYIGFERYDANKTSRSNNATVYTYSSKSSTDIVRKHFTGTVNLSTDGVNPCAFIALRILNGWSGTDSGVTGTATIHNISLREIDVKQQPKLTKQGQFIEEELKEETNVKLHKNGIVETNNLIEF